MSVESLLKKSIVSLNECKSYLLDKATKEGSTIRAVLAIPFSDLPMYINDKSDFKRELVLARLRKEDILNDPKFVLQALWDMEFDMEVYNHIGCNDGILLMLHTVFEELGDTKRAVEAMAWVYSDSH